MKVLALIEAPNHVCYRYRIEAYASFMSASGFTLEALPLSPHTFQRNAQLRQAADADIVVLQRKFLPVWQLRMLRGAAKRLIYDVDDALFYRDSYHRKGSSSWTRLAHFWATIYAADAVVAGNEYLQQQASAYVEPAKVHLVRTCVEPQLYDLARHPGSGADAKLVWIGQHSTLPALYHAQEHLAAAATAVPGLCLHVISNQFPALDKIRVVPRTWTHNTERDDIAEADIGISWLPDDPWSLGKCGLKVLQYMAAGLPVVGNPVGMNRSMIRHGETGFLASTPDDWAAAIAQLTADPGLRRQMGATARQLLEDEYSVNVWGPRWVELLDRLVSPSGTIPLRDRMAPELNSPLRDLSV